ncbi:MAG: Rieske 2Fe-2S domain-containing protein, partial [Verrucomicrobia bacterium]|nr:Rieske 2Fe-2S domain-containing protein [Verrucomicrobiota bacterium]
GQPRRSFVKEVAAVVIGGVATLVPAAAGLLVWLDPLRRRGDGAGAGFVRIAPLAALPNDGVPRKFTVLADRVDAWTKTPAVPVGAVYLRRTGERTIEALQTVCPHAGCFVDYRPEVKDFFCPCHNSTFAVTGAINDPKSPSPRPMDTLSVEVRGGEIWVRYENFQAGQREKRIVA